MNSGRFERQLEFNKLDHFFCRVKKETVSALNLLPFVLSVSLLLLMVFASPAASQDIEEIPNVPPGELGSRDPIFHEPVSRGIYLVFNNRVEEGLVIFDKLAKAYPEHPAPHFFKAAAYQVWMNHYRVRKYQNEFEENVKSAIGKGELLLKKGSDPWVHFYVGASYGYQAFNRFRKHEWIGAYFDSKKGINHLQETLALDQNVYDTYLAFGTYHYWRTAKSNFLRIIAFWIPDKRELGLRQLQFSIDHGRYSPFEASYALITAYFDYGKYKEAYALLNRMIEKKEQPSFSDLYLKARLLIEFERWQEAENTLTDLLHRLEASKYQSIGYQVECKYWLALTLRSQKKTTEARDISVQALSQCQKRDANLEVESSFEDFQDIRDKMEDLVHELS